MNQITPDENKDKPRFVLKSSRKTNAKAEAKPLPKKIALSIGINYANSQYKLMGCLEDVKNMTDYLKTQGYDVTTLTEEKATYAGILAAFDALIGKARTGDTLFVHYSGHGSESVDINKDEANGGKDSTIVPYDFLKAGQITDDVIRSRLINRVPAGCKLFGIMDSCCSGSAYDLRYQIKDQSRPIQNTPGWQYVLGSMNNALLFSENKNYAKTVPQVYMLSGCQDSKTSADAYVGNGKFAGALTYCFLYTMKQFNKNQMKWKHLLYNVRGYLTQAKFQQVPQLSAGTAPNLEDLVYF